MTDPIDNLTDDEMQATRDALLRRRDELAAANAHRCPPNDQTVVYRYCPEFAVLDSACAKFGLAPYDGDAPAATASIHELFEHVRQHPDFAFGAIFVAADFPGRRIPKEFSGHVEEGLLAQYGSELIDNGYGQADEPSCDECGATAQATYESAPGPWHAASCSLHTDED